MRRFLHYLPEAPELAGHNVVRAAPVVDPRVPQTPAFKVIGLGSLLQVQLPPSIKLVAQRNALTGVLGKVDSLASRLRVARSPLLRLLGAQPVLEQTVVGTQPLVCLLGSTSASARHLTAVELDGSRDWVVTRPGQVHAYCGAQLRLSPRSGWRLGGLPFTHTIVTGRGWLSLASPLSVVQLKVPQGESVLVQKNHLNAYTLDTNAAQTPTQVRHLQFDFAPLAPKEPLLASPEVKPTSQATAALQRFGSQLAQIARAGRDWLRRLLNAGNSSPFIEIHGPSTVLVSAAARPRPTKAPGAEAPQPPSSQAPAAAKIAQLTSGTAAAAPAPTSATTKAPVTNAPVTNAPVNSGVDEPAVTPRSSV